MTRTHPIEVVDATGNSQSDVVAIEEPLEIRLGFERRGVRGQRNVAITMRTPGHDHDLAVGFLHGERILRSASDVLGVKHCGQPPNPNVVRVDLIDGLEPDLGSLQRSFYTTSSCGVCGKSSLEALDVSGYLPIEDDCVVAASVIHDLGDRVRTAQTTFDATGGLHAACLATPDGELICVREDVGRHNAVDKVIGWAVREHRDLRGHVLHLSGRASFELLQKALSAQIPIVCAVGAPSSLAVNLAQRFGVSLLGFVRGGRFNIYAHPQRVS